MPPIRYISTAIIFCLAAAITQGQPPTLDPQVVPGTPPNTPVAMEQQPAEKQIDIATVEVRRMERIAAKLDQTVDMLNQSFKLEGNYYKDTGNRVRLQLNLVGLGDTGATMLQVCDGKILWDFQKVLGMQSYRKREIAPILKKLENLSLNPDFKILMISNMGFGGPEAMLTGLRKAVGFDQMSEEKLDGIDVYKVGGTWRDRSNLLGPNDRPLPVTAPLPPYVPTNVWVYIGKYNGWPYKIEMIGKAQLLMEATRDVDPATGRPIGQPKKPPKVDPSRLTLRYTLLPLTEIKEGLFDFTAPPDVAATSVKDETEELLAVIDQYIQMQENKAKAEEAKKEASGEPLLKAPPIEVRPDPNAGGLGTPSPAGTPTPR